MVHTLMFCLPFNDVFLDVVFLDVVFPDFVLFSFICASLICFMISEISFSLTCFCYKLYPSVFPKVISFFAILLHFRFFFLFFLTFIGCSQMVFADAHFPCNFFNYPDLK